MLNNWNDNALIYHIFPIGAVGAPWEHTEGSEASRILKVIDWIPHIKSLGFNTVLFGPVFESVSHGYDTTDYKKIDSRLGTNEDFKKVCAALKENGFRIMLDGVFNHVGRCFPQFRDVQEKGQSSEFCDWFANLNFGGPSPMGDPFWYEGWNGHYNLVKLNLANWHVCDCLMEAVYMWITEFDIDGLRLDAADCLNMGFVERLKRETSERKSDFWLMGEIIHGDYNRWAHAGAMDSVTNYECYKGIYSSHNDKNYFEIGHSINRQSGNGGIYKDINLYTFVDNHDVSRLASQLKDKADIENCYTLLYTMPGVPSVYYGSEFGIEGQKQNDSDNNLRPEFTPEQWNDNGLPEHLKKLGQVYNTCEPLRRGTYNALVLANKQLVFERDLNGKKTIVALNCDTSDATVTFHAEGSVKYDVIFGEPLYQNRDGNNMTVTIPAHKAVIIS